MLTIESHRSHVKVSYDNNWISVVGLNRFARVQIIEEIDRLIMKHKIRKELNLDISNNPYIDSDGIGILISLKFRLNSFEQKTKITIKCNDIVYEKLSKFGYDKLFNLVK